MPNVTVKNIPDELYERLKRLAEANRRSINSEIIVCIERAVSTYNIDPDSLLASARSLREKTAHFRMSDADFDKAKSIGRE